MHVAPGDRVGHRRFLADAARRPQNGAVDDRILLPETPLPEHRIRAHPRPRPDDCAGVEERRALDRRAVFDAHVVAAMDVRRWLTRKRRRLQRPSMMSRWTCVYFSGVPMSIQYPLYL